MGRVIKEKMDPTKLRAYFVRGIQDTAMPDNTLVYVMRVLEIPASMVPREGDQVVLEGLENTYEVEKVIWVYEGFLSPCVNVGLKPDTYMSWDTLSGEAMQETVDSYLEYGWEIAGEKGASGYLIKKS